MGRCGCLFLIHCKKKKKSYQLAPVPFLSMQSWFPCVSWLQVQTLLLCSVTLGLGLASTTPRPWASDCSLLLPVGTRDCRALCRPWGITPAQPPPQRHQQETPVPALQSKTQPRPTGTPLSSSELQQPREHTASAATASESPHLPPSAASTSNTR